MDLVNGSNGSDRVRFVYYILDCTYETLEYIYPYCTLHGCYRSFLGILWITYRNTISKAVFSATQKRRHIEC